MMTMIVLAGVRDIVVGDGVVYDSDSGGAVFRLLERKRGEKL